MTNRLKKLNKEEVEFSKIRSKLGEKDLELKQELENSMEFLDKLREAVGKTEAATEDQKSERDRRLNLILQLQNRAKWHRAIKDKRYRLAIRDEDKGKLL